MLVLFSIFFVDDYLMELSRNYVHVFGIENRLKFWKYVCKID